MTTKQHADALAWDYAIRIINPEKKRYAKAYADFKRGLREFPPNESDFTCSYMAKQAVRQRINGFYI